MPNRLISYEAVHFSLVVTLLALFARCQPQRATQITCVPATDRTRRREGNEPAVPGLAWSQGVR
jgi:hypothetical protein